MFWVILDFIFLGQYGGGNFGPQQMKKRVLEHYFIFELMEPEGGRGSCGCGFAIRSWGTHHLTWNTQ